MVNELCLNEVLIEAVKEVFETMIFMDVEKVSDDNQKIGGETIMGIITFQNGIKGCLAIHCSQACARAIAINMLGMEPSDEIDDNGVKDAIGEVTNMVMGSVKSRVQDDVNTIQVSIPTIVKGQEIENHLAEKENSVVSKICIENQHVAEISFLYTESDG